MRRRPLLVALAIVELVAAVAVGNHVNGLMADGALGASLVEAFSALDFARWINPFPG